MNEQLARRIYLEMHLTGKSMTNTLAKFEVGRTTFYEWRKAHAVLAEQIDGDARVQAEQLAAQYLEQSLHAKAYSQRNLEASVLAKMGQVLDKMLEDALGDDPWLRLGIWREAVALLQKGIDIGSAAEPRLALRGPAVAALPSEVPDPFGAIHRVEVEGADGSRMTFERGNPVDGEWTEPDGDRTEQD